MKGNFIFNLKHSKKKLKLELELKVTQLLFLEIDF